MAQLLVQLHEHRDVCQRIQLQLPVDVGGEVRAVRRLGAVYRWITSLLVHQSFSHVVSNMVLFLILAGYLEHNYGTIRIFVIFIASGELSLALSCLSKRLLDLDLQESEAK